MALSEHEQRILDEMERALVAEDPRFVSAFSTEKFEKRRRQKAPLMTLLLVLGLAGILAGLALNQPLLGVAAFVAAVFGLYGIIEAAFGEGRPAKPETQASPKKRGRWTDRAGERFDRRRDEQ